MRIYDSHCHLDDSAYDADRAELLQRAEEAGVARVLNPGYDIRSSTDALAMATSYEMVRGAVGIHPQKGEEHNRESYCLLEELAVTGKPAAIGEIGLDYYWMKSPKQAQHEAFVWQLELAERLSLPVIVHSRDAAQETFDIVKAYRHKLAGLIMHCYSGSWDMALEYVKLGCLLSLAGPVTFKNARKAHEVAAKVPLSHLLTETDGPYLAPEPHRGKRNEPGYTRIVVERIAEIRGLEVEAVAEATYENAAKIFGE